MNTKSILIFVLCLIINTRTPVGLPDTSANEIGAVHAENIIVAVIDSKINTEHEYLKNSCLKGKSFILNESNETGHGTAVAGAVIKYSSIAAKQLYKSESNVSILPIEINALDIQTDYGYLMGEAIQYAVDEGARIINMSFSSSSPNIHVYEKIKSGIEKGVIFVSAAGNSGSNVYSFPAAYDGVISVGSYSSSNNGEIVKSSFSNTNDDVELLLPGEKMLLPDDQLDYSQKSGTSFSAGALSGIIGEFISRYPELDAEIVYALFDTANKVEGIGCGYGIPDINAAKNYLEELKKTGVSPLSYDSFQSNVQSEFNNTKVKIPDVSAGRSHIAYIENNEVKIYGNTSSNRAGIWNWENTIKVYAGDDNTVAINSYNNPMAAGYNIFNKNIFRGWTDIKELALSSNFTAGLGLRGNIYVTDYLKNTESPNWSNIKQISAGSHHIAAVTENGSVLTTGFNIYGQMDTTSWKNIIFTSSNTKNTAAIDKYGNVFATGDNLYGQCELDDWKNIVSIHVGDGFVAGLKSDGTVVAKGRNIYNVCEVENLKNIVYIDGDDTYIIAIDNDNNSYIKGRMTK